MGSPTPLPPSLPPPRPTGAGLGGLGTPPHLPMCPGALSPPAADLPCESCGRAAAGVGEGLGAGPGVRPPTSRPPSFRDCLCVTARRFPSALPSGGCRAWPRVLIPDKPALCQATREVGEPGGVCVCVCVRRVGEEGPFVLQKRPGISLRLGLQSLAWLLYAVPQLLSWLPRKRFFLLSLSLSFLAFPWPLEVPS